MDTKDKIKLYMVSLGPADHELVTIKGLKALQKSGAVCVPTKSKDNSFEKSITHKIVKELMEQFGFEKPVLPVYSPMRFKEKDWQYQIDIITDAVEKYGSVSFVTLGDAAVYSTVYYLLDMIKEQNPSLYEQSEVVPGITSFSHASSKVKKPLCLGDNRFELIPLIGREVPSTKIYMRPKVGFDTEDIKEQGEIYTFQNMNFEGENIQKGKIEKVEKYMTLFIDFNKTKEDEK